MPPTSHWHPVVFHRRVRTDTHEGRGRDIQMRSSLLIATGRGCGSCSFKRARHTCGGLHHRILAGGVEAKCHREYGSGADQAVHVAVHGSATGVSGHDGVDRQPINVKREVLIGFDLLLVLIVGLVLYAASARPAGATRILRPPATIAGGQRARGRWGGARGNRRPHLRIWLHSQPSNEL